MKNILSNKEFLNEYRNFPMVSSPLMILKNDIEHKLQCGDKLTIKTKDGITGDFLFNYSDDGEINVLDNSNDKYKFFDLDLLGKEWTISVINGQKVVIE